jgi:O-antigen/teichoic acid export membrane protein
LEIEFGEPVFKEIFRNTAAYAASRVTERVTTVLLSIFVARKLGPSGLGTYSAAMVFFALISSAADMGAPNYLIREISKARELTGRYVVHFGVMTGLLCSVVVGLSWLVVPHLGYSHDLRMSVYLVAAAVMPGIFRSMLEAVFVAHRRVEFVAYSTGAAAVIYAATTLLLLKQGFGAISLVAAFAVMQYCLTFAYCIFLHRYISAFPWEFDTGFAIRLVKDCRVFAGSSILAGLTGRPEIFILSLFRNEAQIGFYSAALRISDAWTLIPDTFMTNVYAALSKAQHGGEQSRFQQMVQQSIKYLLVLALPLAAGLAAAAPAILMFLYGPAFDRSAPVLRILAWCVPMSALHAVLWRVLAARNQQHLMLRAQAVTTVFRFAIAWALIAWSPVIGAALTTVLWMLAHNALLAYYVRRDGMQVGLMQSAWRVALAAIGMGLAASLALSALPLWVVVPCAGALYAGLLLLLKGVSSEDLALLRRAAHA